MRKAAGILGILFGLGAFMVFGLGFGVGSGIASDMGQHVSDVDRLKWYGIPLLALAGAMVTFGNGMIGGIMMIAGAIGIYFLGTEWGSVGFSSFTLYLGLPIALAGVLAIIGELMGDRPLRVKMD